MKSDSLSTVPQAFWKRSTSVTRPRKNNSYTHQSRGVEGAITREDLSSRSTAAAIVTAIVVGRLSRSGGLGARSFVGSLDLDGGNGWRLGGGSRGMSRVCRSRRDG